MDRYSEYGRVSEYRFIHSLTPNTITTGSMAPLGPIGERMQSRSHTPEWLKRDFVPSPSSSERPPRRFRLDSPCRALDRMQGDFSSSPRLPVLAASSPSALAGRIRMEFFSATAAFESESDSPEPGSPHMGRTATTAPLPSYVQPPSHLGVSEDAASTWMPSPQSLREVMEFSCNGERLAIRRAQNVAAGKYDIGIRPRRPRRPHSASGPRAILSTFPFPVFLQGSYHRTVSSQDTRKQNKTKQNKTKQN